MRAGLTAMMYPGHSSSGLTVGLTGPKCLRYDLSVDSTLRSPTRIASLKSLLYESGCLSENATENPRARRARGPGSHQQRYRTNS